METQSNNLILLFITLGVVFVAIMQGAQTNHRLNKPFNFFGMKKFWWFGEYLVGGKAWSKVWHILGLLIRIGCVVLYVHYKGLESSTYIPMSYLAVLCYPIWNIIHAIMMDYRTKSGKLAWWATGTTASFDKLPDRIEQAIEVMLVCNLFFAFMGFNLFGILNV